MTLEMYLHSLDKISQILSILIAHAGYILLALCALQSEYAKDGVLYMAIAAYLCKWCFFST